MNEFFSLEKPIFSIIGALLGGAIYITIVFSLNINIVDYEMLFCMAVGLILANFIRMKTIKNDEKGGIGD